MKTAELLEAQYNSVLPDSRRRYDYQMEVGCQLLEGQNVVLRAPTGCGKTLAVLAPFLVGLREGRWRRLIYALPLRSLANGIYEIAQKVTEPAGCHVTLQTGEQPDDPFFDIGDVIVTTYDQVLSGLLCSPYGLGRSLHNVNAAAVASALVVFDEFHLMEAGRAFLTAAATLHLFSELSQSAWLTATATSSLVEALADALQAVSLAPSEQEVAALPCVAKVDRRLCIEEHPLTARRILECHTGRTLVVTNQVRWAQDLFLDLERLAPQIPKLLLHSLFFRQDRASKEEQMRRWFGPEGQAEGIIVATQVVEAGLDLTCDQLHTTICPMNAFVQRAGRNARFPPAGDNLARGQVHVYPLPDGSEPWRPYNRKLVDHTWELLSQHDGARMNPGILGGWVETIHAGADQKELGQGWRHRFHECITKISRNSIQGRPDEIASLIREVPNVRVVLDTSPPEQPLERDGFSVSRGQIKRLLERLGGAEGVWGWRAGESEDARWQPLLRSEDADDHYLLCLAPVVAAYDDRCGLRLGVRCSPVSRQNFGWYKL